MPNRIDLALEPTPNNSNQRWIRNIIAVIIVTVFTAIFAAFSPRTEIIKINLTGEGCAKTDLTGVSCELTQGDKKLTLRECSNELPCNQSEYQLGKKKDNKQYIVVLSEAFGKSVEVLTVDTQDFTKTETQAAFYTEVKDNCKNKDTYTQDCFDFPVSEEQLKDIAEQNKKYNILIKDYSL
jgi:hypothetical protein